MFFFLCAQWEKQEFELCSGVNYEILSDLQNVKWRQMLHHAKSKFTPHF